MTKRVALITGGMGGLGETISTKMSDAGYRVAVTYSPSNTTSAQWLADMKTRGYDFRAFPCDVVDYDACAGCVAGPWSRNSVSSRSWSTTPASPKT